MKDFDESIKDLASGAVDKVKDTDVGLIYDFGVKIGL
jgi:hypothetical protein